MILCIVLSELNVDLPTLISVDLQSLLGLEMNHKVITHGKFNFICLSAEKS